MKLDRHLKIIDLITKKRAVKNEELMETFDISIETVRRDLKLLEREGHLRRVYGGAVANITLRTEPEYNSRSQVQNEAKSAIANAAINLIAKDDIVFMGVGTTVEAMAEYINKIGKITVFTNALRTAAELSKNPECTVILPGGTLRPNELTLSGFPSEENFSNFNVDKAFIGIGGINEFGVTDFHLGEAQLHRTVIKNAKTTIILADSDKLGVRAMNNVCSLEDVDYVITDKAASKQILKSFQKVGIKVIIAED